MTIAQGLILIVLPVLLAMAAGWDVASFTIPNFLQLGLVLTFLCFAVTTGFTLPLWGSHLLGGAIGLGLGFALFAFGFIGGGDAKLFACMGLWFGLPDLLSYGLVAAIFGGVLTLVLIGMRRFNLPSVFAQQGWLLRLHDSKGGIPYGVALAAGAFAILPQAEIFHLAAGG